MAASFDIPQEKRLWVQSVSPLKGMIITANIGNWGQEYFDAKHKIYILTRFWYRWAKWNLMRLIYTLKSTEKSVKTLLMLVGSQVGTIFWIVMTCLRPACCTLTFYNANSKPSIANIEAWEYGPILSPLPDFLMLRSARASLTLGLILFYFFNQC